MTQMVLPAQGSEIQAKPNGVATPLHVSVHVQADVINPAAALHKVDIWLAMHGGHLLVAEAPELILGEPLRWRFTVVRAAPRREQPGTVARVWLGYLHIDAVTGEVIDPELLIEQLTKHANALPARAA